MNLFKSKKNLLLLAASVIVWLGTCLLAMHWNTVYDGAIGGFPTYLWVFAPVALIFNIFMNSRPNNPDGRDHSRWAQALLVFLVALMLFIALLSGMNPLLSLIHISPLPRPASVASSSCSMTRRPSGEVSVP